ncbi:radical SAM protein [Candidatus Woesearchaeota archaeon]|nr:radical SAM protein [Candidatus Woesearchaeota archaeon]
MPRKIYFHRAIFLSWYCSKGDCKFCYMSTQKDKIKNPRLARRTEESILAETIICRLLNWKIEFLSGGYDSYEWNELVELIKQIKHAYGKKLWLNIGTLNEREMKQLLPYIEGVSAPVECISPGLRKELCPSKPMPEIEAMLEAAGKLRLKKSMTIILGLGETIENFILLKSLVEKYGIDRITFYRLKPQKETIFENAEPITKEYYAEWISMTKSAFPKIKIIAGSWLTHLGEISLLIKSGADGITKFPSIKKFNSKYARQIEREVRKAGCDFRSRLTKKPDIDMHEELRKTNFSDELKAGVMEKLAGYLGFM